MLTIGIIDDEQRAVDSLQKLVKEYLDKKAIEYRINTYFSGLEMLNQANILELIFLDIEMPDLDGIEVGKKLNKVNPNCTIVIATINKERFKESFKINAFRYITKPFEEEEVQEAIESYIKKMVGTHKIDVFYNRISCQIQERDICYIKAYDGYTLIYSKKEEYRSELSLTEYERQLDKRIFFRINRTYIINLLKIDKYQGNIIHINGKELKISRRNIKAFKIQRIKADAEYSLGV